LFPIVAVAAYTGARRGEILALRWSDFDATAKTLRIERALEDTASQGIRIKGPKTERGKRTIAIDDGLVGLLSVEREKYLRLFAGVPDGTDADLSLVKLPDAALIFPSPADFDFTRPRRPRNVTKEFARHAAKIGFGNIRFHDLRGSHETLLLDAGVPVHVVAARCGHDPAVLLRSYATHPLQAGGLLPVISANLGHADTRMIERHYGHSVPPHTAEAIRATMPKLGLVEAHSILPIASS
jgi:integrase